MFKRFIVPLTIILLLSACSQTIITTPTPTTSPSSGIEGHVTEGPTCPGPVPVNGSTECADRPYQATISILDTNNKEVTRFETDAAGYFKINLQPGTYTLHPISEKTLPHAADQSVVVVSGEFTPVAIMYDTGMR